MDLSIWRERILLTGGLKADKKAYEDVLKKVSTSMPDKYVPRSLSPKDRATQRRNILKSRAAYKQGKYLSRPKVKSYRSKPSRHVVKAKKMYGIESMTDLDALHRATGCSRSSMEKILSKGRGAFYSSGSRPNQSAESWALARLASAVTGGKAGKVDINELREGGCNDSVVQMALRAGGFKWMSYADAHTFEAEAAREQVSEVARGPNGFMRVYEAHPSKAAMEQVFYGNISWAKRRDNFVKRHLAQYRKNPTRRRYLAMAMWAYDAGWPFRGGGGRQAVAVVRRCDNDARIGEIRLRETSDGKMTIKVVAKDAVLRNGRHGFHLHRCGDERNPDKKCGSLCEHYSRHAGCSHGGKTDRDRHAGDLGNLESKGGSIDATMALTKDQLTIDECVGRAFVVHEDEDDLGRGGNPESKKTGNAGGRFAYAIVGRL